MSLFQFLSFLCVILTIYCGFLTTAQPQPTYAYHICKGANFTNNSPFHANLKLLLSSLSSSATPSKRFHHTTIDPNHPDKAYGLFLCRGDVTTEVCKNCVETASKNITEHCPTQKEPIIWYDECMLRYSNRPIMVSTMEENPTLYMWNTNNLSNPDQFNTVLSKLMDGLVRRAANGSSALKYAAGEANVTRFQTIYAMVQCTPDLSKVDCNRCLLGAVSQIPTCCDGKQGGRVIQPSCELRYEINPFYDTAPAPSTLPPRKPPPRLLDHNGMNSSQIIVIVVVPSVIALVILSIITIYFYSRWRTKKTDDDGEGITSVESLQFDFDTIEAATDSFSDANKIGKGGFGAVYKGRLSHGQEIAVKRLSRHSGQGEEQFKNEVLLVAKLQHRNLVKLLGFCIKGEERLLIYEFVPNTSLDHFVFDPIKCASLNWEMRHKIIGGIARGLLYLHEDSRHRIIHRDLKVGNILLDAAMNPKISDFGMARLFVPDQTEGSTDRIVGTYGYMSPEYAMHGQFSVKSDVYSFGVLLLEIVCGQKNNSFYESERFENLLTYAWRHWNEGTALELMDPTMRDSFSTGEVIRCIHVGLLCVQDNLADRPTMASVVLMLGSYYSGSLAVPLRPAFCLHRINSNTPISNLKACSVNEVSNTEIYPR